MRMAADARRRTAAGRRPGRGSCRASTPGRSGGRCSRRPSRWRRGRRAAQAAASRFVLAEQQPEEQRQAAEADDGDDVRDREDPVARPSSPRPSMGATGSDRLRLGLDGHASSPASSTASCPAGSCGATTGASPSFDRPLRPGHTLVVPDRGGRPLDRPRPTTWRAHLMRGRPPHRRAPAGRLRTRAGRADRSPDGGPPRPPARRPDRPGGRPPLRQRRQRPAGRPRRGRRPLRAGLAAPVTPRRRA